MLHHSKSLATICAVLLCLVLTACTPGQNQNQGITGIAKANIRFSTLPQPMDDFSAIIRANDPVVNPPSHTEVCLADPSGGGFYTAPGEVPVTAFAAGKCKFTDLTQNTFYNFT